MPPIDEHDRHTGWAGSHLDYSTVSPS
jgi:hypothetical protein